MESRVAIINIYFGKLPEWFQLWLNSCKENEKFNWIVFTNDKSEYKIPKNVKIIYTNLELVKIKIEEILKFKTQIDTTYKLCDFKVIYGKIFSEYLKEYTHWGYCDLDMIFGKLENFITDEILIKHDRIFNKGHLTIYKNNEKVNNYYKLKYSGVKYEEILKSKYHYGFDESKGMDLIYKENRLNEYRPNKTVIADINFSKYKFCINNRENYKKQGFIWEKGKIIRIYNEDKRDEFAYIHFQKRNMKVNVTNVGKYQISPIGILDYSCDENIYINNSNNLKKNLEKKLNFYKYKIKQKIYRKKYWGSMGIKK